MGTGESCRTVGSPGSESDAGSESEQTEDWWRYRTNEH